jgi:hypothetical protein
MTTPAKMKLENEILDLIGDSQDIPNTDIQGILMAILMKYEIQEK